MATDYDISRAFKRIENELIDSMIRNLKRHRAEELKEGYDWEQWQAIHLQELERYRYANAMRFQSDFSDINAKIDTAFRNIYDRAETEAEARILDHIRKGNIPSPTGTDIDNAFFGVNERQINALTEATKADFVRGEHAILRKANDEYRKVIYDSQMYAASGATYEQAVDMATKDYLRNGIQSIVYKNGARHTMHDYAQMAIRTGNKRAYLMGEGNAHEKYGIHTVRVNKRTEACPLCVGFLGKVLVDDVYSGGTWQEAQKLGVPTLSQAMDEGFLHPNCKDVYSMYIEGVSRPAEPWTKEEIEKIAGDYNTEQEIRHAENMVDSYERMAKWSLDPDNQKRYKRRANRWNDRANRLKSKGNILSTGGDKKGSATILHVNDIDYTDTIAIHTLIDEAQAAFKKLKHEETVIVTSDGKVWYGISDGVTIPLNKITSDMEGAYVYHNHPDAHTNYSFGEEDIASFLSNKYQYSKAADSTYEYEMWRTTDTIDGDFDTIYGKHKRMQNIEGIQAVYDNDGNIDTDKFHEIAKLLSKEYGFEYRRKKIVE